MINRRDAMNARDGMETYKSGDMQLRVSLSIVIYNVGLLITLNRLAGELVLDLATAVIIRLESV
jgi:hypothetical protein